MRKWIVFFLAFALLIGVSFSSYLFFYRAEFVSNSLGRLYGVPVKVSKVRISKSGIKLLNVVVYNPSEFVLQPALSIACIDVRMQPKELFTLLLSSQPCVLKKIRIVDPLVGIEMLNPNGTDNNWIRILASLANELNLPTGRRVKVSKIDLQDIVIEVRNRSVGKGLKRPPPIGHIEMSQVEKDKAMTIPELVYWVTRLSLLEIGERLPQSDFTKAIESAPQPQTHSQILQIR